jgi:hypothetical protein
VNTACNPGRWVLCVGTFELVGEDGQFALEQESQRIVELAELLGHFRYDPSDPYVGRVKITIEGVE